MALDLQAVPIVDGHCHPPSRHHPRGLEEFKRFFTESHDPRIVSHHVQHTLFYQQGLVDLASFMGLPEGVEASEVLARRNGFALDDYLVEMIKRANTRALVVDYGYPVEGAYGHEEFNALMARASCQVVCVQRLEPMIERLIVESDTFDQLLDEYLRRLSGLRLKGVTALKSIIGYRTGLKIERTSIGAAARAFDQVKATMAPGGAGVRVASKPLLDFLTVAALEAASEQGLPVQFHTGLGDTDIDLLQGNPLLLRSIFEDTAFRDVPIVLLHCYPYLREAAYLSSMYGNVYIDLSMTLPVLNYTSPRALEDVLGLAPTSKLLYGSDAPGLPDFFWLAAVGWKRALNRLLTRWMEDQGLSDSQARLICEQILYGNSKALYQINV